MSRSYVAAWTEADSWGEKLTVLERDTSGTLFRLTKRAPHYFYVDAEECKKHPQLSDAQEEVYETLFGRQVRRMNFPSRSHFKRAKEFCTQNRIFICESDFAPIKRMLMDDYYNNPVPTVNYAFLDIEVDYRSPANAKPGQQSGFAGPTNPYAVINAVTVFQSWSKKMVTVAIPPSIGGKQWHTLVDDPHEFIVREMNELIKMKQLKPETDFLLELVETEEQLIARMIELIADADIISGWNSEFYDIPYICERMLILGGEHLMSKIDWYCHNAPLPEKKMTNRFGSEEPTYRLGGRCHLDYLALFKKFTFEGRTSYALGNILQEEVGLGKLDFIGTLEQLYNGTCVPHLIDGWKKLPDSFDRLLYERSKLIEKTGDSTEELDLEILGRSFARFCLYNRRDVGGLVDLDSKFRFIALANQMAHENTVLFEAVLGTVAYVETGITNHAHNVLNKIVHDKKITESEKVEGAIVMNPFVGLHEWVGSVDINSLYPNTIRSLNISPEMIVGQFEHIYGLPTEHAWQCIRNKTEDRLTLILENGEQIVHTAAEWRQLLIENKMAVSAFGTVFDQSNGEGVVAHILGHWYSERKRLQAEKKKWGKEVEKLKSELGVVVEAEMLKLLTDEHVHDEMDDLEESSVVEE